MQFLGSKNINAILRTESFDLWMSKLKDARAKARIIERVRSAERGNFGDCKSVGQNVSEMRIHFGSGYRVYFTRSGYLIYLLLCGGTKRNQKRDIAKAQEMARLLRNENEITYRFESRFILSDYVAKRQEYSSMPTFSRLVRQAARLSKTGNLFNSRS
jgi:putative addiction module killer protein